MSTDLRRRSTKRRRANVLEGRILGLEADSSQPTMCHVPVPGVELLSETTHPAIALGERIL